MDQQKPVQVSTPTDTTLVLVRTFRAPRRLVWEAMFVPDRMRRWMLPPPGLRLSRCECDARAGGVVSLAWASDGGAGDGADPAMTLRGTFTEAAPYARAVHTETMALASGQTIGSQVETHEFTEQDGVTTMRITQAFDTKDARDGALSAGMEECMEPGYRRLDAMLAEMV